MKKYKVIYADPPWSYRDKASAGERGAGFKYKTQSQEWLKNLDVKGIADNDCVLFLWVTMPKLNECFDLIKAWGFEYKTVAFTWVKRNKKAQSWFWGMGRWTRANAEVCLIATRGKPKRISAAVHSVIDTPIEEHSKKPSIVRDRILSLMGGGKPNRIVCTTKGSGMGFVGRRNKKRHKTMRTISIKMRSEIAEDPFMKHCCIGKYCEGKVEWHHVWIYAGRQINEPWAIVPACKYHHDKAGLPEIKQLFEIASLRRTTEIDLQKYSKKDWSQIKKYLKIT